LFLLKKQYFTRITLFGEFLFLSYLIFAQLITFYLKMAQYFRIIVVVAVVFLFSTSLLFDGKSTGIINSGSEKERKTNIGIEIGENHSKIIPGPQSYDGNIGFPETVEQIMERDKLLPQPDGTIHDNGLEERLNYPDRHNLQQNPDAKPESSYPPLTDEQKRNQQQHQNDNPQTVSTSFTGITVSEAGFIPADNMGAVGPTQYVAIANGRIKSFTKSTGTVDGVINTTTDNFFNSVRNGSGTSDPRIRYDRMSQKWFVVIVNVSSPNRILIAVSNTSTITAATTWLYYFISPPAPPGRFYDYPTLGIDNSAVYIGTNDFNNALTMFLGCSGYVINKAGLIAGSTPATLFILATTSVTGPYTPQGVDNFDASSTEGY